MNDNWFSDQFWDSEQDEDLIEFEKMLSGEKHSYSPNKSQDDCYHSWVETGRGPVSGEVWYNCEYCEIAREDHVKKLRSN